MIDCLQNRHAKDDCIVIKAGFTFLFGFVLVYPIFDDVLGEPDCKADSLGEGFVILSPISNTIVFLVLFLFIVL